MTSHATYEAFDDIMPSHLSLNDAGVSLNLLAQQSCLSSLNISACGSISTYKQTNIFGGKQRDSYLLYEAAYVS